MIKKQMIIQVNHHAPINRKTKAAHVTIVIPTIVNQLIILFIIIIV